LLNGGFDVLVDAKLVFKGPNLILPGTLFVKKSSNSIGSAVVSQSRAKAAWRLFPSSVAGAGLVGWPRPALIRPWLPFVAERP
jgi:hypothetical protein